jgi:hypothetical protein
MDKLRHDVTFGTGGWFEFAAAPVGLTRAETTRLSIVNLCSSHATVLYGVWQNPRPVLLLEDSCSLAPGEVGGCDLKGSDLPKDAFDDVGRAQVRPFVRSSCQCVCANVEVFDGETGKTSVVLPLRSLVHC